MMYCTINFSMMPLCILYVLSNVSSAMIMILLRTSCMYCTSKDVLCTEKYNVCVQ